MTPDQLRAVIERAKAQLEATKKKKLGALAPTVTIAPTVPEILAVPMPTPVVETQSKPAWSWNKEQWDAITQGVEGRDFCMIGAAGTGKTTTLRGLLQSKLDSNLIPMLKSSTQYLFADTPGIVLVSYTRRAVRNIAKQMPAGMKDHCLTIHKLIEFAPEVYFGFNEQGMEVKKMRFAPTKNKLSPLPKELKTIVVDESSMVSIELFDMLLDALPDPTAVQFIFLGDLNQLPPVYGQSILGKMLLQLPIVELTQVYRQALESPIISLALSVKNNNFSQFNRDAVDMWSGDRYRKPGGSPNYFAFDAKDLTSLIDKTNKAKPAMVVLEKPGRGKVTLQVWKNRTETEVGLAFAQGQIRKWIELGYYDPDEDLVLCAWGKSFGADELNRTIADQLGKMRDLEVNHIIAGFQNYYYAVGDKLMVDKQEAIVTAIEKNPKYLGKRPANPSKKMDRWGNHADKSLLASDLEGLDIDELLADLESGEDRVAAASHVLKFRFLDSDNTGFLSTASEFNATQFAYAMTVHKAQGSECRKVFFITHYCHSAMLFRELVYTAATRAAEELHIVMSPMMLQTAAAKPRIKGDTLEAKLEFYAERLKERNDNDE